MPEERTVKKAFENTVVGERFSGKPRKRRFDDVKNDLKMGARSWRKIVKNRAAWNFILKEAKVLHGPYRQWRERQLHLHSI
jgi:hypothetical protein